jgi:SAM-dependent methyltransferase
MANWSFSMNGLIDYSQRADFMALTMEGISFETPGDLGVYTILTSVRPKPSRLYLIGGHPLFVAQLIRAGYRVVYIDKNHEELVRIKTEVCYFAGKRRKYLETRLVDVQVKPEMGLKGMKNGDAVAILRVLHYLPNPHAALRNIRKVIGGSWFIVADKTVELAELDREKFRKNRELFRRNVSEKEFKQREREWVEADAKDKECVELLRRCGLRDEDSTRRFLESAKVRSDVWLYNSTCPCHVPECTEDAGYWFSVSKNIKTGLMVKIRG